MSSSDEFDGPTFRAAGRRGADDNSGGAYGGGGTYGGGGQDAAGSAGAAAASQGRAGQYPAPEGWGDDGFWRDSAIDSDYETGLTNAVRQPKGGPRDEPGYSYFADGKGWQSSPGKSAQAGDATSLDATRAALGAGGGMGMAGAGGVPGNPTQMDYLNGPGGNPTAVYRGGPGGPAGPGGPWRGGPGGPGGRGPGRHGPGGPVGRNGKRKGNWWRHWTWKKALAVTGGFFVLIVIGLFGVYQYMASNAVIPAALASANYQNTVVYYADGKTPIGTIGPVDRQDLTFSQIPKSLQDAVLAAEDRNFWTEGGISPTAIARAAVDDLLGRGSSGASTITQEFVRNYYQNVGTQQTVSRKIKEIFIAQKLAGVKSKQWILTNYLNLIYLGNNSYGVAAAAQTYFGLPVSKLSIAQDAVLAAIIQQPSTYPLPQFRSNLINRWRTSVLDGMVKMGDLTQAQADAMQFPKLLTDSGTGGGPTGTSFTANKNDPWAPYIMNVVQNELEGVDHVTASELEYGGMKVVTTISRPMEVQMYKAVDENAAQVTATGGKLPSYVMVGAELQNPSNGQIIAMYPGRGQNMSAAKCKIYDCDDNTAVYTREQVGSSFKPYVLSTAVSEGMNVQSSTLQASSYLCVPPDYDPMVLSQVTKSLMTTCSKPGWFPVENDGGEIIGNPKKGGGTTVQNALAQSSNTAYTDLAHRATTSAIIRMAQTYGVNISAFSAGGSNLTNMVGQVGLALGTASLTVNEQDQMLATIADNGVYHQAHIIKYWQQADGSQQTPTVASHLALNSNPTINAQLDSQVQYAMEMTTVDGTGTAAAVGLGNREILGKTGTTSNSHSGFFIGAIKQYALVVGMFTQDQNANSPQSLIPLGGGGFGGYWPAKIWNTFAQAVFANLPQESFSTSNPVVFTGQAWNQVGKLPPPKKKKTNCITVRGGGFGNGNNGRGGRKSPNPTSTCIQVPNPGPSQPGGSPTGTPVGLPTNLPSGLPTFGQPSSSATATGTPNPTISPSGTATPTATATGPGNGNGGGVVTGGAVTSAGGVQGGLAVGGLLAVLPGSLLWTAVSRRRRRRGRGGDR